MPKRYCNMILCRVVLLLLVFQPLLVQAQQFNLPFSGRVEEFDEKKGKEVGLEGAVITLLQNGAQVTQVLSNSNGKFNLKIPGNGDYVLTITKGGYITKRFSIVTTNVPDDRAQAGFGGYDITVGLFKMYSGLDYSVLNKPIAKINYNSAKDVEDFDYDKNYTAQMLGELEKLKELEKQVREREKRYNTAIASGDKAFQAGKYAEAKPFYEQAKTIKPDETYPPAQIAECDRLIGLAGAQAAKDKEYADAISQGNASASSGKYDDAIASFEKALTIKPGDNAAQTKLADAKTKKQAAADAAKKDADYNAAMQRGNDLFTATKFEDAKKEFQAALALKAGDAPATKRIADCDAEIAKQKSAAEAQARYEKAMAAAQTDFGAAKYADAKKNYQEALAAKAGDAAATKGISDCDAKLGAEAKYNDAMKRAGELFAGTKYEDAKKAYQEALTVKAGDAPATKGIADCDAKLKDLATAAAAQQKYDNAMKAARDFFAQQKYNEAKKEFQNALAAKAGDAEATKGVSDCDAQLAIRKKYDDAMKAGATAMTAKKYSDAVTAFSDALAAVPGDATATAKRDEAQKLLDGQIASNKNEADYQAAMTQAKTDFAAAKYEEAKSSYQKALTFKAADAAATKGVADCDAKIKDLADKAAAKQRYDAAMARGNTALAASSWDDAITAYNEALAAIPKDAEATKKLAEANAGKNAALSASQKKDTYDKAMAAAKEAFGKQDYTTAKTSYQKALGVMPGDEPATKGIADCDAQLAVKKKYDDAMKAGAAAMTAKKYADAVTAFGDALSAVPGDATATTKRDEAQKLLDAQVASNKTEADYQAAMKTAKENFTASKFEDAKTFYNTALSLKAGDAAATKGIADCDNAIAARANYAAAMKRGDAAMTDSKWDDAIAAYTDALTAIPKDAEATKKLAEANSKKSASLSAAQKKDAYDKAMAAAKEAFGKQDYTASKASYQKALGVMPGDEPATKGIADCDAQLAVKKKYDDAMKAGATAMTAKKYADAVTAFGDALAAIPGDATATTKRDEAQKLLDAQVANNKTEADYLAAMKQAKESFGATKYEDAKTFYNTALSLKTGDAAATKGVADCDAAIAARARYSEAMSRGDAAMNDSKWDDAVTAFTDALNAIPKDAEATKKLADANAKKSASLSAAQKKDAYDKAMAAAKTAFDKQDYLTAKTSYQKALGVMPGDEPATKGISECEGLIATKKKYDDAMKLGATAMTGKKYQDAVNAFTDALTAIPGDAAATAKRDEAQKMLDGQIASNKNEADYQAAMKKAQDLFKQANYTDAKSSYEQALGFKAGDGPAQSGINQCDLKLKELADKSAAKARYDEAMKRGGDALGQSKWDDAIAAYNEALNAIPKDPEATKKLAEANKGKLASLSASQKQEAYDKAMAAAKALFAEEKYPEAKKEYQNALTAKPADDLATKGIADCDLKINEAASRLAMQKKYDAAMNRGNTAMADKKYKDAVDAFTEALGCFPGDEKAQTKLDAARAALNASLGAAQADKDYNDAMKLAAQQFKEKKFDEAKSSYQKALGVRPGDAPATKGIADCDAAIAQKSVDDKYNGIIAEADRLFEGKSFADAKPKYKEALDVKPGDAYAQKRMDECDKQIALLTVDGQYQSYVDQGNRLFGEAKYVEAREAFVNASKLKPTETYPKEKVGEIDRLLKKIAANEAKYKATIEEADKRYAAKDFKGAKEKYQEAVPLKPADAYPKLQIIKCDQALNPVATNNQNTNTTTDPYAGMKSELASKYPQGVTEETGNEPNCQITRRIVVKGNVGWVYTKKVYSWGGVYYFKDGVPITENAFLAETATK